MTASLLRFCRKSSKQSKHQHKQDGKNKLPSSSSSSSSSSLSSSAVPSNQPYLTKTSKSSKSSSSIIPNFTTKITMQDLKEFTSSIPLRLSPSERALLTVLESTLTVSEYTDTVDVASTRYGGVRGGGPKIRRILDGVLEACHVATGLGVAGMLDHPSVVLRGITSNGLGSGGGSRRREEEGGGCSYDKSKSNGQSIGQNGTNWNTTKSKSTTTDGTVAIHISRKKAKQAEKARKKEEKRRLKMKGKKKKNNKDSSVALEGDDETTTTNDDTKTGAGASDSAAGAEDASLSAVSAVEGITIDSSEEPTSTTSTTTTSAMTTDDGHDNATNNNNNDTSSSSNNNENKAPNNNNNNNKTHKSKTPKQNKNNNTYHPHVPHYKNLTSIALLPPSQNELFFQNIFEIGRRNKVLNPSKMRDTYGKLMHLLQDAQSPSIAKSLGFSLYKDMVMVRPFLEARGLDGILDDERLVTATMFISTRDRRTGEVVDRGIVEEGVRRKKDCIEELLGEYADRGGGGSTTTTAMEEDTTITTTTTTTRPSPESLSSSSSNDDDGNNIAARQDLQRCIDSIADAIAVVECNVSPVRRMLHLLEENFSPHSPNKNKGQSLELRGSGGTCFSSNSSSNSNNNGNRYGYGFGAFGSSFGSSNNHSRDSSGPTLNHSHSTQYTFVWQSLRLWEEVQMRMHKLWVCADDDLLSTTTSYQLLNTGQGLNRVQSCPRVGRVMRSLLSKTQKAANAPWVGLSVIHLGDRDVPNALVFIDKYTQIPRFLKPVVDFCDGIPDMCTDRRIASYVDTQFGSEKDLEMAVLADYFKHGFDGSGDDGGSCIDGRLTSSWNWTSRVVKKNYYHFFMLSGFQGFDGDFK